MKPETENNGLCIDHHKDGTCVRCGRDVDTDDQECIGDRPMTVDIETLAEHVADTLWLSAFADAIDYAHENGHDVAELRAGPGEDWADCPYRPVPAAVQKQAADALARIPTMRPEAELSSDCQKRSLAWNATPNTIPKRARWNNESNDASVRSR